MKTIIVMAFALASYAGAQTKDAAPRQIASGSTLPASCTVGQLFVDTSSTPVLKLATATGPCVWSQLLAASGGPFALSGATGPALATPASGFVACWFDSTAKTFECINDAGTIYTLGSATDAKVAFSDITTGNATTSNHGFLPKLSGNTGDVFNGQGAWITSPSSVLQDDPSVVLIKDDFFNTRPDIDPAGEVKWNFSSTGTPVLSVVDAGTFTLTGHPGVKSFATGTGSGDYLVANMSYSGALNIPALSDFTSWQSTWIGKLDHAAGVAGIANLGFAFGLTSAPTSSGSLAGQGWYIAMDSAAPVSCAVGAQNGVTSVAWNTANIMYVMKAAGSYTCVDSGVAARSDTWYHFKISSVAAGTATFTINGSNSITVTSGGPTVALSTLIYLITHTTSSKAAWHDFFSFSARGLTR